MQVVGEFFELTPERFIATAGRCIRLFVTLFDALNIVAQLSHLSGQSVGFLIGRLDEFQDSKQLPFDMDGDSDERTSGPRCEGSLPLSERG